MEREDIPATILSVGICEAVGISGSLVTAPSVPSWYASLRKPSFNPPSWVFGPVWTILYGLMGFSLSLVWRNTSTRDNRKKEAVSLFGAQLFLNSLWTYIFFGLKSPFLALIELVSLWVGILLTIRSFLRISRTAGLLLVPYLLWTSFALILNYFVWKLNK